MPPKRRRKTPITAQTTTTHPSSTVTASLIRRFHVLIKQKTQAHDTSTLARINAEIDALGGLEAYQRMSTVGQGRERGGGSERVLIEWLREQKLEGKLRLLEVGALKHDNYASCEGWIEATPMDLRSQHPGILEQDFLLMDMEENRGEWDVISLSLVLNFVPSPKDRGKMLQMAAEMLSPQGYLFLAVRQLLTVIDIVGSTIKRLQLPLPCVTNSRYLTMAHLTSLMAELGFGQMREKWKSGGKMGYWFYQKTGVARTVDEGFAKKRELRGGNRNNFCILVPS